MRKPKTYPSDPTPKEWAVIEPLLRRALYGRKRKRLGAPRKYSLYDLTRAMLYVLRNGIHWRELPHDLPPWQTVYYHFRRWQRLGVWEQVNHALVARARRQARAGSPQSVAIDSQSVPTTQKGGRGGTTGARRSKGASGTSWSTRTGAC
jgi:transposase